MRFDGFPALTEHLERITGRTPPDESTEEQPTGSEP